MTAREQANAARRRAGFRARGRRGFALMVVLFGVILLSVIAGGFAVRATTAEQLARSRARGWEMLFAARSAVEEAKARVWREAYGTSDEGEESSRTFVPYGETGRAKGVKAAPESFSMNIGGVEVSVYFEDEAGKVPVNRFATLDAAGGKELSLVVARLFDELDLPGSTSLATALRDFVDTDSSGSRESGAKNAPLVHPSELLAAKGFDEDALHVAHRDGVPAMVDCLSVWHVGQVNLNSAPAVVLSALAPRLTDDEIGRIIESRLEKPFDSADDLKSRLSISADAETQLLADAAFETEMLTLYVEARRGPNARRVRAVVWIEPAGGHTLYIEEGWDF